MILDVVVAVYFAAHASGLTAKQHRRLAIYAVAAIPPLTGPGPDGEWDRWEEADEFISGTLYHFIPEGAYRG